MTVKNAFVCSIHEVIYPHDKALRCYVKIFIVKSLKARKSSLLDKGLACRDHRKVFIQKSVLLTYSLKFTSMKALIFLFCVG